MDRLYYNAIVAADAIYSGDKESLLSPYLQVQILEIMEARKNPLGEADQAAVVKVQRV